MSWLLFSAELNTMLSLDGIPTSSAAVRIEKRLRDAGKPSISLLPIGYTSSDSASSTVLLLIMTKAMLNTP